MPTPKLRTRNTRMVLVSILPDDLHSLDAIAAEIAEPGMAPNRSKAVRELIRDRMAIKAKTTPKGDRGSKGR